MKAGRASIRYRWMRRTAQGIALAAGSVALLGSLCAGQASAATQSTSSHVASAAALPDAKPLPGSCYKARDGWLWYDLDNNLKYQCIQNIFGQWKWVLVGTAWSCPAAIPAPIGAIKPEVIICSGRSHY